MTNEQQDYDDATWAQSQQDEEWRREIEEQQKADEEELRYLKLLQELRELAFDPTLAMADVRWNLSFIRAVTPLLDALQEVWMAGYRQAAEDRDRTRR